jgi:hypothetical protein
MSAIMCESFDSAGTNGVDYKDGRWHAINDAGVAVILSTAKGRNGRGATQQWFWRIRDSKRHATLFAGMYAKPVSLGFRRLFEFVDVTANDTNLLINVTSDGRLQANRLNSTEVKQTDINFWNANQGHHIEAKMICHDTTGLIEVKVDEVIIPELSSTNVDTKRTDATIGEVRFGDISTVVNIDDVTLVNGDGTAPNDYQGDRKVSVLRPIAPGTFTDLSRGGTDTGANWSQVDEDGRGEAEYVFSATADAKDTYDFTALGGTGSDPISFIQAFCWAAKSDAANSKFGRIICRSGTPPNNIAESVSEQLGFGAAWFGQIYNSDEGSGISEGGGVGWTRAKVDAAEFGEKVRDS